jgi:hypothetical protein
MRSVVTKGGIPTFVSTEEYEFIQSISDTVYKSKLDERQQEVAKMLTGRGLLQRFKDSDNGIYYTRNQNQGIK